MPRSPKLGFEKGSALLLGQGSGAGSGKCTHPVWEGQYLPNLEINTGSRECCLLGNPHLTCTAARRLRETHISCVQTQSLGRQTQGDLSSCWESSASQFPSRLCIFWGVVWCVYASLVLQVRLFVRSKVLLSAGHPWAASVTYLQSWDWVWLQSKVLIGWFPFF